MIQRVRHPARARPIAILASLCLLAAGMPLPLVAQEKAAEPSTEEPTTPEGSIEDVPEYLKTGQYEKAAEVLRATIDETLPLRDFEKLRYAYLQLIKTYTIRGNFFASQFDQQSAELYNEKAQAIIRECLRIRELRHTHPDSPLDYPPEMLRFFDDARNEMFGSFRVVGLEPSEAIVILDADTLRVLPGQGFLGERNIPIGPHEVVVIHEGYRVLNDAVNITSGVTLERSYELSKRRGGWWYAGWGSVAVAGVAGLAYGISAVTGPSDPTPVEELPGPPPLP